MQVTDVTYNHGTDLEPVWVVYTIPAESYRPGIPEAECAQVATRVNQDASAPGARGVEPTTETVRYARGGRFHVWADGFGVWHVRISRHAVGGVIAARGALRDELQARERNIDRRVWANPVRVPEMDTDDTVVYREWMRDKDGE